jgi:hypothetical protein
VVLDLLRRDRWRRPVYLALTVDPSNLSWIWPYVRLEGMALRMVPSTDPAAWDVDRLRRLLFERVRYADLADGRVPMDADTRGLCRNYVAALIQLASAELGRGNPRGCLDALAFLDRRVPPARLGADPALTSPLRRRAESALRGAPRP